MKNERLYEFTCPYCENRERISLDLDQEVEIICKKCNQKIDLDILQIVESSNMEFHGDEVTPYNPNGETLSKR